MRAQEHGQAMKDRKHKGPDPGHVLIHVEFDDYLLIVRGKAINVSKYEGASVLFWIIQATHGGDDWP